MTPIIIEAAVETLRSALGAERAGADRLELCGSLSDGGTTPSAGLIASVVERVRIPVVVMIRPRGGHFVYSDDELAVMRRDIELVRAVGVAGIVSGALQPDHRVDVQRTRALAEAADGIPLTFHRAFDLLSDPDEGLDDLCAIGVSAILTSGGAATALDGAPRIAGLVARAAGRIRVIAGGGIRKDDVRSLVARTGVREVHTGVRTTEGAGAWPPGAAVHFRRPLPGDESAWTEIDEPGMRELVVQAKSPGRSALSERRTP